MTELEQYRQEIDRIDGELVQLFLERMAVTGKVGEYKQRAGIPVLDAGREKQVIAAKTALTDDPARKADVAALYEEIMAISRRQQRNAEGQQPSGHLAACGLCVDLCLFRLHTVPPCLFPSGFWLSISIAQSQCSAP